MQVTSFARIVMTWPKRVLTLAFAGVLLLALTPRLPIVGQEMTQAQPAQETRVELQQLVAPIALYPDALVAQILAASTYPTEVVQADRWVQQHSYLQGEQLAAAVDQQSWDPSVKALTTFPTVLANLDENLSWTEALGDAYLNQQQDVLDAVQVMRRRAEDAGTLQTTPQERVVNEESTIVIEPAYPDVCYVPIYDPWIVYGAPFAPYPGYFYDGWYGPPFISFGPAIGLGFFGGFGWGWPAWGFNWGSRVVVFNRNPYVSRSRYFFHGGPFIGGRNVVPLPSGVSPARVGGSFNNRTTVAPNARFGNDWGNRGSVAPRAYSGARSGSFTGPRPYTFDGSRPNGFNRAPVSRGAPSVGRSSFGGGRPAFGGGSRGGGRRQR